MFEASDITRTLLAWTHARRLGGLPLQARGEPDLRLQVILDEGDLLFVEVAQGSPCPNGTMLWLEDRGSYEVAGVLSRKGAEGSRSYMRLCASPLTTRA